MALIWLMCILMVQRFGHTIYLLNKALHQVVLIKSTLAAQKARRKSFKARHAKNISKGKMSAAYWANKSKW